MIACEAGRRINEFNAQGMANTVWAFATAGIAAQLLFEAIAEEVRRRIVEFNAQNMASTVWAFATAGTRAHSLFEAIAAEARRRIAEFNAQNMANTAWAFACAGWVRSEVFVQLGAALAGRLVELNERDKAQLFLVALYVRAEWPELDFSFLVDLKSLRAAYARRKTEPSELQGDVSVMLEHMGWSHTSEYVTKEGILLDLAQPDSKRAIEVCGRRHSLKDVTSGEFVVNGATQFKSRLVRRYGWQVSLVAFFEFDEKSESERRELLLRKLGELEAPDEEQSL
ncbi:MAG: hypothetical protein AAF368_20795 [Planctomycetota bacterium]